MGLGQDFDGTTNIKIEVPIYQGSETKKPQLFAVAVGRKALTAARVLVGNKGVEKFVKLTEIGQSGIKIKILFT
jgi:hypothetical protein